jgi:hypothetical protein
MMKTKSKTSLLALSITCIALSLTGCGRSDSEVATASAALAPSSHILLSEAPTPAIPVGQARKEALPGQEVTVIGQVGGVRDPIAENYASFVMADEAIYFCDEMEDEGCTTPWDACCEDPEKLAANRASVVFLDDQGQPLSLNLKEVANLSGLNLVTIKGVVAPESTSENMIIHASGLYNVSME